MLLLLMQNKAMLYNIDEQLKYTAFEALSPISFHQKKITFFLQCCSN